MVAHAGAFVGGVALALLGATGDSLGCTIQKLSHDTEKSKAIKEGRSEGLYLKRKLWWVGFVVFLVGNLMSFAALTLTGQATVILLGCWGLCVNLYTAPKILRETRTWHDIVALVVVACGIAMAVGVSTEDNTIWTKETLLRRFKHPAVIACVVVVFCVIAVTFASTRHYRHTHVLRMYHDGRARAPSIGGTFTYRDRNIAGVHEHLGVTSGSMNITAQDLEGNPCSGRGTGYLIVEGARRDALSGGLETEDGGHNVETAEGAARRRHVHHTGQTRAESTGLLTEFHEHDRHTVDLPFAQRVQHVVLAGMVATVTVTSAKATAVLVDSSATGNKMQLGGVGLVFVFVLLASLVAQLHFINTSLMVNDALFHLPMFYVVYVFGGVVVGGIVYQEFSGFTWWRWLVFVGGVVLVFSGIKLAADRLNQLEAKTATPTHTDTAADITHQQDGPKRVTSQTSIPSLTEPLLADDD